MIDILTSSMCLPCLALKTALQHEGIAFQEIDIKALGPEEMGELESSAKHKLLGLRYEGKSGKLEEIMSTPIVRIYPGGLPCFLFPFELMDHGIARVEALAGIKAMLCG